MELGLQGRVGATGRLGSSAAAPIDSTRAAGGLAASTRSPVRGRSSTYTYDFGGDWRHRIVVEKVLPADEGSRVMVPACVDGRRACPPEDCGGPWGYDELLAILADPTHPEHDARREWLGRPFDPDACDPDDFDYNLVAQRLAGGDDWP